MAAFKVIISFLLLVILLLPQKLCAQKLSFEGGVIWGIYGVDITGEKERYWGDDYKKSGIIGISAGPFVKCNFSHDLYGVLELRYIQKGTTFGFINDYFTQSFESIRINYIEIPVLFGSRNIILTSSGKTDFNFETGISFARLFSSSLKNLDLTKRWATPSLDGFRNYDVSWVAQVKFPIQWVKANRLLIGFRIERSLISIHTMFKLYNFDYGLELNYLFKSL